MDYQTIISALRDRARKAVALDAPADADLGDTAIDIGAGFVPGIGTALSARDFERARREGDKLGMGLSAVGMIPVVGGIVKPSVAKALRMQTKLPDAPEFAQAVANTAGAQISPEGLVMRLQRNQMPAQSMAPSVRGGVFYLPEGASQARHYATGNNGYGGAEKIVGETLIRNPLFVKGATGGKAPEAALDALKGKKSYEQMRSEALRALPSPWSKVDNTVAVEEFLAKHAPDLEGMGSYIIQNSKKGNQLAYALQEAAVAQAVRDAGHDAVVGYSKGKAGPSLSEVFDVREAKYPNKQGDFELMNKFQKLLRKEE